MTGMVVYISPFNRKFIFWFLFAARDICVVCCFASFESVMQIGNTEFEGSD